MIGHIVHTVSSDRKYLQEIEKQNMINTAISKQTKPHFTFVAFVAMPSSPLVTCFTNGTMPVRIVFQQIVVTK